MYSTKMSFKSLILVLTLVVYSIGQVSALKCYVCASGSDKECYKQPKQKQFEMECTNMAGLPEFSNRLYSGFQSTIQRIIAEKDSTQQFNTYTHKCLTIEGELANNDSVVRLCSPEMMDCKVWEKSLGDKYSGLKFKSCHQCDSDYCNSSSQLSIGFLSLIGSLLTILWMKN